MIFMHINSQLVRFILAGLISNGLSYLVFLLAIYVLGIGHKTAATLLFIVGMVTNYTVNKNWTFGLRGQHFTTLLKFFMTYITGYFLNIGMLSLFVDRLHYSAAWVQFFAIGVLVIYYFFLNKYFIFKHQS